MSWTRTVSFHFFSYSWNHHPLRFRERQVHSYCVINIIINLMRFLYVIIYDQCAVRVRNLFIFHTDWLWKQKSFTEEFCSPYINHFVEVSKWRQRQSSISLLSASAAVAANQPINWSSVRLSWTGVWATGEYLVTFYKHPTLGIVECSENGLNHLSFLNNQLNV